MRACVLPGDDYNDIHTIWNRTYTPWKRVLCTTDEVTIYNGSWCLLLTFPMPVNLIDYSYWLKHSSPFSPGYCFKQWWSFEMQMRAGYGNGNYLSLTSNFLFLSLNILHCLQRPNNLLSLELQLYREGKFLLSFYSSFFSYPTSNDDNHFLLFTTSIFDAVS